MEQNKWEYTDIKVELRKYKVLEYTLRQNLVNLKPLFRILKRCDLQKIEKRIK